MDRCGSAGPGILLPGCRTRTGDIMTSRPGPGIYDTLLDQTLADLLSRYPLSNGPGSAFSCPDSKTCGIAGYRSASSPLPTWGPRMPRLSNGWHTTCPTCRSGYPMTPGAPGSMPRPGISGGIPGFPPPTSVRPTCPMPP